MTQQNISAQEGAGVKQDLGNLDDAGAPSGSDSGAQTASDDDLQRAMAQSSVSSGQSQDLGFAPSFTNPATGDIQPTQDPNADQSLSSAIAAARLGSGPTVGSAVPGGPQPNAQPRQPNTLAQINSTGNWNLSGFGGGHTVGEGSFPGVNGSGTVGGLIGTGGTEALTLRQEMAKQKLANQKSAYDQQRQTLDLADRQAEIAGTGRYALENAKKRADLAKTQQEIVNAGKDKTKPDKNPPAQNISSEPVIDQGQLNRHIDGIYGQGSANDMASTLNEAPSGDPNLPNENAPVVTDNSVTVGPKNHRITMPKAEAQVYVKQANALRIKQGLPPYPVPGETDQTVGATAATPYIARTNLDVYSRPPGTWVRLPSGKIAQVPGGR